MNINPQFYRRMKRGFTLPETMMAIGVLAMVMASVYAVYITGQKVWTATSLDMRTSQENSLLLEKIVYGGSTNRGIRAAMASSVVYTTNTAGWTLCYATPDGLTNYLSYSNALQNVFYWNSVASNRLKLADGVSMAAISVTGSGGLLVTSRVSKVEGRFASTNEMSTFITFRN